MVRQNFCNGCLRNEGKPVDEECSNVIGGEAELMTLRQQTVCQLLTHFGDDNNQQEQKKVTNHVDSE